MDNQTDKNAIKALAFLVVISALIWFFVDASVSVRLVLIALTSGVFYLGISLSETDRFARENVEKTEKALKDLWNSANDHRVNDRYFDEKDTDKKLAEIAAAIEALKQERNGK